jgi:hypothetical protein
MVLGDLSVFTLLSSGVRDLSDVVVGTDEDQMIGNIQ